MPSLDASEAGVETLVLHAEAFVIDPEIVQHGGVEVINVNRVLDDVVGVVVGFAVV